MKGLAVRRRGLPLGEAPLEMTEGLAGKSRCLEGGDSLEREPPSVCIEGRYR